MSLLILDLETELIGPGRQAPPVVSVGVAVGSSQPHLLLASDPATSTVTATLLGAASRVVGHNVAFDLACLVEHWPELWPVVEAAFDRGAIVDTMLAARLYDVADSGRLQPSYSLDAVSQRWLGRKLDKGDDSWRLRYAELAHTPIDQWPARARDYAEADVAVTRELWHQIGMQPTLVDQTRAAWALHLTSCRGVRADAGRVLALRRRLDQQRLDAGMRAKSAGLLRSDGSKDRASASMRLNSPSVTRAAMRASGDADLDALATFDEAQKVAGTFLPWLEQAAAGPVHPRYQVLVESGRTSSFSPNIQQLPRAGGVREVLVPRPGFALVVADYAVAELVCLASYLLHRYGRSMMADALRAGRDLHLVTAASILHCDYQTAVERYQAGDAAAKRARTLAKILNFGAPGGIGVDRLAELLDVDKAEAATLRSAWLDSYPELRQHFADLHAACKGGAARMVHPMTRYVRGGMRYTAAANHCFQNLCATAAKSALYRVVRACYSGAGPLGTSRPWAFVHDEIVIEVPVADVHEAAAELERLMVAAFDEHVPGVPVRVDALASDRWSKDAKRVLVDGRLVVWSPD